MYAYIKGILMHSSPSHAIIETQGIGFFLSIPFNHFAKLPPIGEALLLYTSYVVREDSQRLYGFLTQHEKELFEELIEVSGIGPKTALGLVGHMDIYDLQTAIQQGQSQLICKVPGIGKKTAERLIVELKDKMKQKKHLTSSVPHSEKEATSSVVADAISALINLGYNQAQVQKSVQSVLAKSSQEPELAALITAVLRII